ncbi:ABC transporter permease [SAR202 cluster bacterium AD-802-E10_MRT_200m]|nr:ABC transporter permease [SAR202 cluster bacterium AD-802-E10_MRT_200m]MQF82588.1 ABC transporter permease [SAR202 cluster bacterium AD-802-E10_MRT_200m]
MQHMKLSGNITSTKRSNGYWINTAKRMLKKPKAIFSVFVIIVLYGTGIFAPVIAPYHYNEQNLMEVRQGPSTDHVLGTDFVGRDVLSRVIFSLRTNLIVTAAAVATGSILLGVGLGLISGYFGGRTDSILMRIGEIFLAFPGLLLVILIAATIKPRILEWVRDFEDATGYQGLVRSGVVDYFVVFGALSIFSWVGMARLVRGQILSLKELEYVEAARAMGASSKRIILIHLLPNALPPIIVMTTIGLGATAGAEVVLSWLGIGIQPPVPSLGNMIQEGQNITILRNHPHLLVPPIIIVGLLIFAWNLLGDALNDILNPRSR